MHSQPILRNTIEFETLKKVTEPKSPITLYEINIVKSRISEGLLYYSLSLEVC